MIATSHSVLGWIGEGFRGAAAMVWMTFWPLVLGFGLSGWVQAFLRRDGLRTALGTDGARGATRASMLGILSSSCSYAASAMARAVFGRGATWTNSMIFMIASTNLVIELGIVLWVLLGWQFLVAEFVGGALMIVMLRYLLPRVFSRDQENALRQQIDVGDESDDVDRPSLRVRLRSVDEWSRSSRFTMGDLTMLRKELFFGFLVAGFLAVHVPTSWWRAIFVTGHGPWTLIENVIVAIPIAVISFVCSVGNIPLAAALWSGGIAFGGVIAFVFADLVTLPLLLIYRRFYGPRATWKLFLSFWFVMSAAGLLTDLIFRAAHAIPDHHALPAAQGDFPMGATLVANIVAAVALAVIIGLSRRDTHDDSSSTDPVCGMQVIRATAAARATHEGTVYYFCSPRCEERFSKDPASFLSTSPRGMNEDVDHIDPICSMSVDPATAAGSAQRDGVTYYFCGLGCRDRFLAEGAPESHIDPICGMTVDPATAAGSAQRNGVTYYFCGLGCRDRFLAHEESRHD